MSYKLKRNDNFLKSVNKNLLFYKIKLKNFQLKIIKENTDSSLYLTANLE